MRSVIAVAIAVFFSGAVLAQDVSAPPEAAPAAEAEPAFTPTDLSGPFNPVPSGPMVTFQTSMGDFTIQLDAQRAPKSVDNFLRYVRARHYDGTAVYRVEEGFIIQLGSWDAQMNYRQNRAPIPLEANNGLSNLRGSVALARGDGPDEGATAEFFINIKNNTGLDQAKDDTQNSTGYAVFGQVIAGMDVIDKISAVPVGINGPMPGSAPETPIVVRRASVLSTAN